jgi:hypothetical protein
MAGRDMLQAFWEHISLKFNSFYKIKIILTPFKPINSPHNTGVMVVLEFHGMTVSGI